MRLSRRNSTINIVCTSRGIRSADISFIIADTGLQLRSTDEGTFPPREKKGGGTTSRRTNGIAAHLLVQPEAVRLIGPVHDVLQVLSHELEELLEHLLNLGFLERTHDDKLCRAPPPSITWTRTRADVTPRPPKECREGYLESTTSCLYFNPRAARVWARLVSACLCVGGGGWSETESHQRAARFSIDENRTAPWGAFISSRPEQWRRRPSPAGESQPRRVLTCWASTPPIATRRRRCTWAT